MRLKNVLRVSLRSCYQARNTKIVQADEAVGKTALVVPLLVSKALELFLQDLCDCTYEITLKKGAKTMNSFPLFRKVAEEDDHDSDDDIKRNHMNETANNSGTGRGRGRGRGRGCGRGARAVEKGDSNVHNEKLEDPAADVSRQKDDEKPKQNDERMVDHVAEPATDSKNNLAAKCPSEVVAPTKNFYLLNIIFLSDGVM